MTGKKASIRHVSTPMSLETFLSETRTHCQTLASKDVDLREAYRIFAHSMDISPEQYRQINTLMQQVGETVEELCLLLSDPESLPQSARSCRYLPLVSFQYMDGQIQTILSTLARMRQLRKTSSLQKDRLKQVMNNKLKSLRQDLQEGLGHIRDMSDQALLEEKRKDRLLSRR
ncbi:MAG TPA: hypothetical protein VFB60_02330 [Ktedonobacteraceae bacterium]|nr:hypothetical protein [Ktedonobacteraceae bacterium]